MEPVKVTLCSECECCPTVEIDGNGASIGEGRDRVKLTHAQWNDLVARVQRGELKAV